MCDQGKTEYRTESAARSAISGLRAKGNCPDLYIYQHEDHFHVTKTVPRRAKLTRPSSRGPAPFTPSAAKLRRQLANGAAQIRATEKRLTVAERIYFAELDAIEAMTTRLFGSK
jgi:hypothetical protein